MPFKSEKQRKFMHANHPDIAHRWEHEKSGKQGAIERRLAGMKKKKGGKK